VVVHTCNPSTREAEAVELFVGGKTLFLRERERESERERERERERRRRGERRGGEGRERRGRERRGEERKKEKKSPLSVASYEASSESLAEPELPHMVLIHEISQLGMIVHSYIAIIPYNPTHIQPCMREDLGEGGEDTSPW
jgi:hypothetical protein